MHGTLLATAIYPDNTPHGYNLTFAFPMLMFIIIATSLYLRFRSPHRVPGHNAAIVATTRRSGASASGPAGAGPVASGTTTGSTLHKGEVPEQGSQAQEAAEQDTSEESE